MDNPLSSRWARLGPYQATFPLEFAAKAIEEYAPRASRVLDPFAGRGTSIYTAAALGREAIGVEIHPVAWIYGETKLHPASRNSVLRRLAEISSATGTYQRKIKDLPEFFRVCFCDDVLNFLFAVKDRLKWRTNRVDRTLMAFVLNDLHNNIGQGLSNQMKQTLAMSPEYSLRWWRKNGRDNPPRVDPQTMLRKKIEWRYAKGVPEFQARGKIFHADSEKKLRSIKNQMHQKQKFSLLLTSPPYWSVVNYHSAQWLRLWVLGGDPAPKYVNRKNRDRFLSKEKYKNLLLSVFSQCADLMKPNAVVCVRTDAREFTLGCTRKVLQECFPNHRQKAKNTKSPSLQSAVYKNAPEIRLGETDIVLTRN